MTARGVRALLMLAALAACRPSGPSEPPPAGAHPTSSFPATVRIVEEERVVGRKAFRGVLLEKADGARVVADYGIPPWWRIFDGERVVVEAEPTVPQGQALVAPHVRVKRIRHASRRREGRPVDYIEVSEERVLHGRVVEVTAPPGTKLAGEKSLRFVVDGGESMRVGHAPPGLLVPGSTLRVRARVVDVVQLVSVAAVGGPSLWILELEP